MSKADVLTVTEVAKRLRVNPETVRVWLRDGKLRGFRPGGTKAGWRIRESEVEQLLGADPTSDLYRETADSR